MFISELSEPQLIVIYPGRFQPFHKGHAQVFEKLAAKFGKQNVFIATANKTGDEKHPFTFSEKSYFMQLQGIPADRIVESSQPYRIENVLASGRIQVTDPNNTIVMFAVSEKDMAEDPRFASWTKKDGTPAYFQPAPNDLSLCKNLNEHGYILTVSVNPFTVLGKVVNSASSIRELYATADEPTRQQIVTDVFGRYTQEAEQIFNSRLLQAENIAPAALPTKTKLTKVKTPKVVSESEGKVDPKRPPLLIKARMAHPLAQSDQEALALYLNDKEQQDVGNVEREEHDLESKVDQLERQFRELSREVDNLRSNAPLKEFAPDGFDGSEDDNRVPMHFVIEKDRYNRRSKWRKSYKPEGGGIALFTTKQEAMQAAEKYNKIDPNREFAYGGTQMADADLDEGIFGGLGGSAAGPMLAKGGPGYAGLSGAKKLRHDAYVALQMVDSLKHTNHNGYYDEEIKKKLLHAKECLAKAKEIEQGLNESDEIAQPGQLVQIIQAPRMLDLLPGETFEVRSSNEQGVTLKHGMGTKFDNVIFPHGTYKILSSQGLKEAGFDREAFRRQMADLEAREQLRKTDPVSAKALDLRGQLPQATKKKPEDDSMSINDPRHPGAAYTQGNKLDEFAPDEGGEQRKFIPWPEFIEQLKQILSKNFSCKENIVKSTIKARFVPHDPMEFGPTMLYSYYETRAGGRNKGAVSTRGSIQVGKYTTGGLFGHKPDQLLTGFSLLKGHPFERHFDLTFDNIYKIANIIQGNTQGALQFNPELTESLDADQQVLQHFADVVADSVGYDPEEVMDSTVEEITTPSGVSVYSFNDDGQTYLMGVLGVGKPTPLVTVNHSGGGMNNELEISVGDTVKYAVKYGQKGAVLTDVQGNAVAQANPNQDEWGLVGVACDMLWGKMQHRFNEGDVVAFPKKHKGDLSDTHSCPKCGGDLQGGKYMGHEVKVCMPCKQVYLPPNTGIDQQGNKIKEDTKPTKYRATVEYGPTAADAHFVTVTATSTEEAEAKVAAWCKKKGVRNPMITINGADKPVDEGFADTIKHKMAVRSRAKNISNIRKREDEKSVFEKDPEAMREFERSGGYAAGIDVMGWQVGWAAAKHAKGQTAKEAFQKLYYGGGSPFPFSIKAFKLAWVAYNKHHGPEAAMEQAPAQSCKVEAWGYVYDRRDQRVMWRKEFGSETSAKRWADLKNATIMGMKPLSSETK